MRKNLFATTPGIIIVGAVIGLIAVWVAKARQPGKHGDLRSVLRTRCGRRLGLHRAAIVQYLRPEIMGLVLGSLAAAISTREFKPRGGSAPIVRLSRHDSRHGRIGTSDARGARYSASPAATETPSSALPAWPRGSGSGRSFFQKGYSLGPRQQPERRLRGTLPRHRRLPAPSLPHFPANPGSAA